MNKDFSKHHEIIDKFRGEVNKKDFESKYVAATEHLNKTEKFLLKMELKRLATPCTRGIDLRGLVSGECQLFDYQGQSHFLDEVAIAVFKESANIYGGYTFGVYEAVKNAKNSFRNIYETEKVTPTANDAATPKQGVEKRQFPARLNLITIPPNRAEERMNFAIPINVIVATGANNKEIKTTSIDISTSGIKFKLLNEIALTKGDELVIEFTGLAQEFQFSKEQVFYYKVQNVFRDSGTQIVGCQRVNVDEKDSFTRFLQGYIQGNKRRYKINLDNSLTALQSRIYEQYALEKINELPIFLERNADNNSLLPRYVLTTQNNLAIYQYWKDEKNNSALPYLVDTERLKRLRAAEDKGKSLLVYSFIHQHKGNKFFYALDQEQLAGDKQFFYQYIAFAAKKASFAITELKSFPLSKAYSYSPYTLSTAMTKQQSYLNPPLSDEVNSILDNLPLMVSATNISNEIYQRDYAQKGYEGINLEKLKSFGKKATSDVTVDEIILSFSHQRQEMRFKFKTPVYIESGMTRCGGESVDFSISGMKIDLGEVTTIEKGDIVYLSFPKLQKITSSFDLKKLPYKVVRLSKDKTKINLRVSVKEHQHIGRSFFKLLIDKNKSKLTPDEYAMLTPGLSGALRNLFAVNMVTPSAIVQSSGSRYKVEVLVAGEQSQQTENKLLTEMSQLSDRNGFYNLYPLLGNLKLTSLLDQYMKKLLASDTASYEYIYIAINPAMADIENRVTIKQVSELPSGEMRRFFISNARKKGEFYSVKLTLSRTNEPNLAYISPELAYISSYAIHRGKQLEQELYSVAGVIQIIDITQETLFRHQLLIE